MGFFSIDLRFGRGGRCPGSVPKLRGQRKQGSGVGVQRFLKEGLCRCKLDETAFVENAHPVA